MHRTLPLVGLAFALVLVAGAGWSWLAQDSAGPTNGEGLEPEPEPGAEPRHEALSALGGERIAGGSGVREGAEVVEDPGAESLPQGRLSYRLVDAETREPRDGSVVMTTETRWLRRFSGQQTEGVLSTGEWTLAARVPGYEELRTDFAIAEGQVTDLGELPLQRGCARIRGRLRPGTLLDSPYELSLRGVGRGPCRECPEDLRGRHCDHCGHGQHRSLRQVEGYEPFVFERLASGPYLLQATRPGSQVPEFHSIELTAGAEAFVELELPAPTTLAVDLRDPAGLPFTGVYLDPPADPDQPSSAPAEVRAQLLFELRIEEELVGFALVSAQRGDGQPSEIMISYESSISLDGPEEQLERARSDGDPVAPLPEPPDFDPGWFEGKRDPDLPGRFVLVGLPATLVELRVRAGSYASDWTGLDLRGRASAEGLLFVDRRSVDDAFLTVEEMVDWVEVEEPPEPPLDDDLFDDDLFDEDRR